MEFSDVDRNTLKSLREMLLRDIDEYQYAQLLDFRNKLIDEIKRMDFAISKLEEQYRMVIKAREILTASENDPICAVFDMLAHNINREIDAIQPTAKKEKQLDLERRLATIQGKKRLAALIGGILGIRTME